MEIPTRVAPYLKLLEDIGEVFIGRREYTFDECRDVLRLNKILSEE